MIEKIIKIPKLKQLKSINILSNHPFPLFAYLEWILLSICILMELRLSGLARPGLVQESSNSPLVFFALIVFGIMGLRLPRVKIFNKIIYTLSGLLLMFLANYGLGKGIGFTLPFLLILVIRSCLVFELHGRLFVAALSWLIFIFTLNTNIPFIPTKLRFENSELLTNIILHLQITAGVLFTFILLFVLLLVNTVISERQSRQKLVIAHEQ